MSIGKRLVLGVVVVGLGVGLWFAAGERPGNPVALPQARGGDQPFVRPIQREEPFGFTARFDAELKKLGQITPDQFAARHPAPAYLPGPGFDPTAAKFWDQFNADPAALADKKHPRNGRYDFRLNPDELAAFKRNGFVVSERLGAATFAEQFYRIYSRDLPVFVSADAVLHAWHRSYDAVLEELETTYLSASLGAMLHDMAEQVPAARQAYGRGALADAVTDADYFLAVARSLLAGHPWPTKLGQDDRVKETLTEVAAERMKRFTLFGRKREMDFSQFKPRGRYEKSEQLQRYFRAMMWCGRIDLRVGGGYDHTGPLSSSRELGAAVVLHDLLKRSGRFDAWRQFDALLQTLVGPADSATFAHLDALLKGALPAGPAALTDPAALDRLQADVLAGRFGLQDIRGDVYVSPPGGQQVQLPRSFTVLGQRFALDSWVTAKVVYDDILWDGGKVVRRIPSCLDVAYAALGNDQTVPLQAERMTSGPRQFRDRTNYQHNLAAVRAVIDEQPQAAWDANVYTGWLAALRELSAPTTDPKFPAAMRTREWGHKSLNTQLASWAQLRHDTILYVKQSYTAGASCFYPDGFVEPVPAFWGKLAKLADLAATRLAATPFPEHVRHTQTRQVAFFKGFAEQVRLIQRVAEQQLAQQELTADEKKVLQDVVQVHHVCGGPFFNGWYPKLFYKGTEDSDKWDALVADVHTDVPAPDHGDPGCVLHQGVGNIDLLLVAVDRGADKVVYAGPVLSHYEFEAEGVYRLTDKEWRQRLVEGKPPPRPEWTRGYLVPGTNPDAAKYAAKGE